MNSVIKRKSIGLIVVLLFYPIFLIYLEFNIPGMVMPIIAFLTGPVGLLIMGPSVDGKDGLLSRILKMTVGIAKWGWLLIPFFPADIIVGLLFLVLAVEFLVFGVTFFAFIPALFDFFKTLIVLRK